MRHIDQQVHRAILGPAPLAPRELDVLELMADGFTNEAIGSRLFMSVKSVESAIRSIFLKLGLIDDGCVNRRVLAVRYFLGAQQAELVGAP